MIENMKNKNVKFVIATAIGILAALVIVVASFSLFKNTDEQNVYNTEQSQSTQGDTTEETYFVEIESEIETEEISQSESQLEIEKETQQIEETVKTPDNSKTPNASKTPTDSEKTENSSESAKEEMPTTPEMETIPPVIETYTIHVSSAGGHDLYNVKINAYTDESKTNLYATAATNSKGIATLELDLNQKYVIELTNVPEGYYLDDKYMISEKETEIFLDSAVIVGQQYPTKKLKAGSVMYDFTVPTADGQNFTLSEAIKDKDLIVLNFWYVNCSFCVKEFPYMSNAYEQYKERVEIIALDPFDDMSAVQKFLVENPLPFKVATCDTTIPSLFGIDSYPVSVVIDKHGVIRKIEKGAILSVNGFTSLFEKYL